jgi:hypothetical protein
MPPAAIIPRWIMAALMLAAMQSHGRAADAPPLPAAPPAAVSQPGKVIVRVGTHGTFGRVVFVVPRGVIGQMALNDGNIVTLSMPGAGDVPDSAHTTLHVTSIGGGNNAARLTLAPDSHPVLWQESGRIVVDVYAGKTPPTHLRATGGTAAPDPALARPAAPAKLGGATPQDAPRQPPRTPLSNLAQDDAQPSSPAASSLASSGSASSGSASSGSGAPPIEAQNAAPSPVTAAPLDAPPPSSAATPPDPVATDGLVAARVPVEAAGGQDAILIPFDRGVGAAAFSRAGVAHVIFDDGKPVDTVQLKDDPVFGSARITLLPAATHFAMRLAPGKRLSLHRREDGWVVAVVAQAGAADAAHIVMKSGVIGIEIPQAAATVVMDDPVTGGRLLVGTVRAEGPAVPVPHASPEFSLLPSWSGVLVAAESDRLALRALKNGFSLATATGPKLAAVVGSQAEQAMEDAGTLTRHFDFTPLPLATRRARLLSDQAAAAAAPKLGRFAPRVRTAQDMLALGLNREAGGLLRVAMQDDPGQAQNADALGLLGMADWLAGRGDGAALAAPALGASDETALWRAILRPASDGKAAATLANTWRLLLAYPEPLKRRLLPLAADIMLNGGQRGAAEALLARIPASILDPQRARALQMAGKTDQALALLDRLGNGRDRKVAASSLRDAVELRLASGKITPAAAAAALDRHLYAWRDDALEADQRLRIAALRGQAGAWRSALSLLRETDALDPAVHDRARALERQVIANLLASSEAAHVAPLDLVALVEENADLLAEKDASETLAPILVEKLLALDLPQRADPILAKLMAATAAPDAKAILGGRLAALRLEQGDSAGAKAVLAASDATGLPASVTAHRAVLQARALSLDGTDDAALSVLAAQDGQEALELQAQLLEKRKDWPRAEGVLQRLVRASLPATGPLSDSQQDLVLRLASAASEAGDMALLQQMQGGDGPRLSAGPRAELFQALSTRPIQALADLPRSAREAVAARAVPAAFASYDTH